jgi:hypothetical protein
MIFYGLELTKRRRGLSCWWEMPRVSWSNSTLNTVSLIPRSTYIDIADLALTERIASRKLFFKPYSALNRLGEQDGFKRIDQLQTIGDHSAAGSRARDMIALGLEGLTYYDTYDRTRLRTMVTIGYASFAIYTLLYVWQTYGGKSGTATIARPIFVIDALCMAVGLVALVSAIVEKTPWHVLYAALPIYLCRTALTYGWFSFSYSSLGNHRILTGFKQIARTAVYCVALIGMAVSTIRCHTMQVS